MAATDAAQANGALADSLEKMKLETAGKHTSATVPTDLPTSSKDGLVKKPFVRPLDSVIIPPPPKITPDQQAKYDQLLAQVSQWTEIPDSTARGSKSSPLTDSERMFLTRECLFRYLRATKWAVADSATRLRNTLIWRREYGVEKHTADYVGIENETGKQLILGWDGAGRPCHYMRPSKQNTERGPRQIEHLVYILERDIDMMPAGQESLTLLINFAETQKGQGASIGQGRQTLNILQNHYPERMGRALVMNVPWFISGFFKLITPFIDPVTREKIKFNEDPTIYVPREQLLRESGGDVEFEYVHQEYWTSLNEMCEVRRREVKERWVKGGKRIGEYEGYLKGGDEKGQAEREGAAAGEAEPIGKEHGGVGESEQVVKENGTVDQQDRIPASTTE